MDFRPEIAFFISLVFITSKYEFWGDEQSWASLHLFSFRIFLLEVDNMSILILGQSSPQFASQSQHSNLKD